MDHEGAIKHILNRLSSELPEHLSYHGKHHTADVLEAVERIGSYLTISSEEMELLRVAAAYHDSGFIYSHLSHEEKGCEIARNTLPNFGFTPERISEVETMIMATKVPQQPTGTLSDILCDADLDYLGRDDFKIIADTLYKELNHLGIMKTEQQWNTVQIGFLKEHSYHTMFGKTVRQPIKETHLEELIKIVSSYNK